MSIFRLPIKTCTVTDLILLGIHRFVLGYMFSNIVLVFSYLTVSRDALCTADRCKSAIYRFINHKYVVNMLFFCVCIYYVRAPTH